MRARAHASRMGRAWCDGSQAAPFALRSIGSLPPRPAASPTTELVNALRGKAYPRITPRRSSRAGARSSKAAAARRLHCQPRSPVAVHSSARCPG